MKIFNNLKTIDFFRLRNKIRLEINPIFYWKILLFVLMFGLMFVFLLNLYFFWHLNKIEILGIEEQGAAEQKISKDKLENVLQELDKREADLSRLIKEGTIIEEP